MITMSYGEFGYLEHGKYFQNGVSSEFYELAYTQGANQYSKELRDAARLVPGTPFSKSSGSVSVAFLPVLGGSSYSFVQFVSRMENDFGRSSTDRPFFQTRFLFQTKDGWRNIYSRPLAVLSSIFYHNSDNDTVGTLAVFSKVYGVENRGRTIQIPLSKYQNRSSSLSVEHERNWVCSIIATVIYLRGRGTIKVIYSELLQDILELMDKVYQILLLGNEDLVSFACSPACSAQVSLRFGDPVKGESIAYELNYEDPNTWQYKNQDILDLYNYLFLDSNDSINRDIDRYSNDPDVLVERKKNGFKAFLVLVSKIKGNYIKWFLETNGEDDEKIMQNIMSSPEQISTLLKTGSENHQFRLLTKLPSFMANTENLTQVWFKFVEDSTSLTPNSLGNLLIRYLEQRGSHAEFCIYFGRMEKSSRQFFQHESKNILYDSLKKYFTQKGKQWQPHSFSKVEDGVNEKIAYLKAELQYSIPVLRGIQDLPSSYDRDKEMWFFVGDLLTVVFNLTGSVKESFVRTEIDLKSWPSLFKVALLQLVLNKGGSITDIDRIQTNTYADKGFEDFVHLRDTLITEKGSEIPKADHTMVTVEPGWVSIPMKDSMGTDSRDSNGKNQEHETREPEPEKATFRFWEILDGWTIIGFVIIILIIGIIVIFVLEIYSDSPGHLPNYWKNVQPWIKP